jgi:lipocalin
MSLNGVLCVENFAGTLGRKVAGKKKPVSSSTSALIERQFVPSEDLREFLWLRDETRAAMSISCDREKVWKLYNTLQDIEACIQHLETSKRSVL